MDIRTAVLGFRAHNRFTHRLDELDMPATDAPSASVTDADLEGLPAPARRYLHFMGVVGRPRDWSFHARFRGQFRMKRGQPWMPFDALQYNTATPVTRFIDMRSLLGARRRRRLRHRLQRRRQHRHSQSVHRR